MENKPTIFQSALQYGTYLGLVSILITLFIYIVNPTLFGSMWFGMLTLLITVVLVIFFTKKMRAQQGGFWSFKEAFTGVFIMFAASAILSTFFTFILYTAIAPELPNIIKESVINSTESMMESFGMPQEEIDKAMKDVYEKDFGFNATNTLSNLSFTLIFCAVISLIFAAIFKKEKPMFDTEN